ncbi:hypothetical protein [Clostridium sp.]|uniref:hypothetical protein n=1 Tax=Clostridium sp. TaxID=1506 RepID=UPI00260BE933|nr:hypothetical protein [Clostridium sp.]
MKNLKKKFENETKTRINIINSEKLKGKIFQEILVKPGVFNKTDFMSNNYCSTFPTEILCSSPRNNVINVYLDIKRPGEILTELKENILKSLYESCEIFENEGLNSIGSNVEEIKFKELFIKLLNHYSEMSLNTFYEVEDTKNIFNNISFSEILNEINSITYIYKKIEDSDDLLWNQYFNEFEKNFNSQYNKWMNVISKYYADSEEGYEYTNEEQEVSSYYFNKDFRNLCEIIYGISSSCALMINKAYMEIPSCNNQFSNVVFIEYTNYNFNNNLAKFIEKRISEDYKELFLIITNCNEHRSYFEKIKENVNSLTLDKRIFCILDKFNFYKRDFCKGDCISTRNEENLIEKLKISISKQMGIYKDRIIVTEEFNDVDKNTMKVINTNEDFLELLRLMKRESESIGKIIKIKSSKQDRIINISLNQERMSVQALMGMLYDRYHGYLVDLWNKIIKIETNDENHKRFNYSRINTIIRNRKDDYKDYKHTISVACSDENEIIDFSLRTGDYNDSKKILRMLLNYGYNTIGFDSSENKIIINVNGEISKEDKENLIKSVKGRLEESAVSYFENAFLMNATKNKFNANSLNKALEIEKNVTIDDFYIAFKEMFNKMSDNIIRYEVHLPK